jgi:Flp pilus assembly protein TadD
MDSVGQSKAAITIYEAGLDRWPGNNILTFGCGNLHYKNGAYEAASQRFLSMLDLVPDDVRAWNNLAYSLAELGCQQAIAAAQCAVNLGRRSALHSQATSGTLLDIETTLAQETNNSKSCFSLPSCPL